MKLYDEIIQKILDVIPADAVAQPVSKTPSWPMAGEHMMVLRSEMAYEMGSDLKPGFGATILTGNANLVPQDEILVYGQDLAKITADTPYLRIALVRVRSEEMGQGNSLYAAIRKMEYVRYHFFPEGFMMRISASKNKESVRVSQKALEEGISFSQVGSRMIEAFHENPKVEAVKLVYVTNPDFPYQQIEELLAESEKITGTIDHMLKDVKMDCDVCNLKPVCDEVEGLRELHFGTNE